MSDLDTQIENAIKSGAKLKDIAAHLDQSDDPEHKAWANTYFKRAPIEAATPSNEGPSEGFSKKVDEFGAKETAKREADKKSKEVTVDIAGQSYKVNDIIKYASPEASGVGVRLLFAYFE